MQDELQIAIAVAIGISPFVITPIVRKIRARRTLRRRLAEIVSVDGGCYVCGRTPHDPDCPQHQLNEMWRKPKITPATCKHESQTPFVWSENGWVSTCRTCEAWLYFGDGDGFPVQGDKPKAVVGGKVVDPIAEAVMPEIRDREFPPINPWSIPGGPTGGVVRGPLGLKPNEVPAVLSPGYCVPWDQTKRWGDPVEAERCEREHYDLENEERHSEVTSGEPLTQRPPNIGGEDHPEFKGGNYVEPREIAEEMKGIMHYGHVDFVDLADEAGRIDANGNVTWELGMALTGGIVSIHREELEKAEAAGWKIAGTVTDEMEFVLVSREPKLNFDPSRYAKD